MKNIQSGNVLFALVTGIGFFLVMVYVAGPGGYFGENEPKPCDFCVEESQGAYHFILAETGLARDLKGLQEEVTVLCYDTQPVCVAMVWEDPARVPARFPLTPEQAATEVARVQVNWQTKESYACFVKSGQVDLATCQK